MFGTIRKHQKWLWFVIVGIMIASMALWSSSFGKQNAGSRRVGDFGLLDNKPITPAEFLAARTEVSFLYFLNTGEWPDAGPVRQGFDVQQQTFFRVLLIRRLQD